MDSLELLLLPFIIVELRLVALTTIFRLSLFCPQVTAYILPIQGRITRADQRPMLTLDLVCELALMKCG